MNEERLHIDIVAHLIRHHPNKTLEELCDLTKAHLDLDRFMSESEIRTYIGNKMGAIRTFAFEEE